MLEEMKRKLEPIILVSKRMIRNDCLAPSRLELYDLMYLVSCAQAEMKWRPDWAFCPVCMAQVLSGRVEHNQRVHA
jgi:hypothetical protein